MDNKARFILAVVEDKLVLAKRKKKDVEADMERMGFDKQSSNSRRTHQLDAAEEDSPESVEAKNFNYLLRMPMDHLTLEKVQELQEKLEQQRGLVAEIQAKEPKDTWRDDLTNLRQVSPVLTHRLDVNLCVIIGVSAVSGR